MKHNKIVILAAALISGCCAPAPSAFAEGPAPAQPAAPATVYSSAEQAKLTMCIGMTHNARQIAEMKLVGRPSSDTRKDYEANPNAKLLLALVDKVYGDRFSNTWDYAGSFFSECALNMANVPSDRSSMANYCMQNSYIAEVTQQLRNEGAPITKVNERFGQLASAATPKRIIDEVYARSQGSTVEPLGTWTSCMAPLVAK